MSQKSRYVPQDRFFKKAKDEGYLARSVYKLQEIDQKFKVFRSGQIVLDLGAAPGSWSQYAAQKIGTGGRLLGIDLTPIELNLTNAEFVAADLRDLNLIDLMNERGFSGQFDIVMSDMMAKTTGIKSADQARSLELCEIALECACKYLKPRGTFVCKFFQSGEFGALRAAIKREFERVEAVKPESTRSISKEIFLVGLNKKS